MINQREAVNSWKTDHRINSKTIVTEGFSEKYVSYLLSKMGIDVVKSNIGGFDLLALDSKGKIFPKRKIAGISIKTCISKKSGSDRQIIPIDSSKIKSSDKTLNINSWISIIIENKDKELDVFLFPFEDLPKLRGNARRKDVVAVQELFSNPTGRILKLKER